MANFRHTRHKSFKIVGHGSVADRFNGLSLETDKPETLEFLSTSTSVAPSSSSKSSNATAASRKPEAGIAGRRNQSTEHLPVFNETGLGASTIEGRTTGPRHRRSFSVPFIYSGASAIASAGAGAGSSSVGSPPKNVLPAGNICQSGTIGKTGMVNRNSGRSNVLGSGTGNYGHGSIMRGFRKQPDSELAVGNAVAITVTSRMASMDSDEVMRVANDQYKRGHFADALRLYDQAIDLCPNNAACHGNRAAALSRMNGLGEAMKECEQALRLDPANGRAHQTVASLCIRLGRVEDARRHLSLAEPQPDPVELQKLQAVERHLGRLADARKIGSWQRTLRETTAIIAAGADSSSLILASRAEGLLWLQRLEQADVAISNAFKLELFSLSCSNTKFVGMLSKSYVLFVRAQVDMALGRFENAVSAAERARKVDPGSLQVKLMLNHVRAVARARALGNKLFNSGKFVEACLSYGEGLKYSPSNPVLYCNRAACWSKIGQWERSIEDCDEALRIQPNYTKALLRRAASNGKLERWSEAVRDYEVLRKRLPGDTEMAEALFHAQVALKTSRGKEVSNMKFGGRVGEITGVEQFHTAMTLPGTSVVHFMAASNQHCSQIAPFVDALCTRYPSLKFLKVDVNENPSIAKTENARTVPTFKIYKNGTRVKEMICPSQQVLEYTVKRYCC